MIAVITFILILSLLIFVHELGHFLVAKRNGIRVDEFGFGLPPRILGKKIGETTYSLNLLPFGGFVQLAGDIDTADPQKSLNDPRVFMSKTPLQRAQVLVAGVFMNIVLACVLYYIFFGINGFRSNTLPLLNEHHFRFGNTEKTGTLIVAIEEESAASLAGLTEGEAILEVDRVPVYNINDILEEVSPKANTEVSVLVSDLRSPQKTLRTVTLTPHADEEGEGRLGVYIDEGVTLTYRSSFWQKLLSGPMHVYNMTVYSLDTFGYLISQSVASRSAEPVSAGVAGPLSLLAVIKSFMAYTGELTDVALKFKVLSLLLLDLTALVSISLAVLNLLPFPALDGGRLLFVIIEAIRGKRISLEFEARVHQFGMVVLVGLLILFTVKDIARFF